MVKHNNVVPNQHFRKDWARHVRTWFDQPTRAKRRRQNRRAKAKRIAPRPLGLLRPQVRGCTIKYNSRYRAGRGFTLEELKAIKVNKKQALTIGISIDFRRQNHSQETYNANVARLKLYMSKLILFPKNSKKPKAGEASKEEILEAQQPTDLRKWNPKVGFKIRDHRPKPKARVITAKEYKQNVKTILWHQHRLAKTWGRVAKNKLDEAEKLKVKSKKKKKK